MELNVQFTEMIKNQYLCTLMPLKHGLRQKLTSNVHIYFRGGYHEESSDQVMRVMVGE